MNIYSILGVDRAVLRNQLSNQMKNLSPESSAESNDAADVNSEVIIARLDGLEGYARTYWEMVETDFSGLNLIGYKTFEEFYQKQFIDLARSLFFSKAFFHDLLSASKVVDMGTGGGFPLIPAAFLLPFKIFIGVDARLKRLEAINFFIEEHQTGRFAFKKMLFGFNQNITTVHSRFENLFFDTSHMLLLFKAVGIPQREIPKINILHTCKGLNTYFYLGESYFSQHHDSQAQDEVLGPIGPVELLEIYQDEPLARRGLGRFKLLSNVPRGTMLKKTDIKI